MKRQATQPKRSRPWMSYITVLVVFPATLIVNYIPWGNPPAAPAPLTQPEAPGLSPYDPIIKRYAGHQGVDWRLIASIIRVESHFRENAISPRGAKGLMQIMPVVAREQGVQLANHPEENIRAGVSHLTNKLRLIRGETPGDVLRLSLAAYNSGLAHVRDAQSLATRLGMNSRRWKDVRKAMLLLQDPEFYRDARFGYCKGSETVEYVDRVLKHYDSYRDLYPTPTQITRVDASIQTKTDV